MDTASDPDAQISLISAGIKPDFIRLKISLTKRNRIYDARIVLLVETERAWGVLYVGDKHSCSDLLHASLLLGPLSMFLSIAR